MMVLAALMTVLTLMVPQHEGHMKRLAKRGAAAMGFDQDAVAHHFAIARDGGAIELHVKVTEDKATLEAVRQHLREIATAFGRGDFTKSIATHGEVPPGVEEMQRAKREIRYRYRETSDGGRVTIQTSSRRALEAVHAFLRYQIDEHKTGDPIR
jgi:hypothetical protein